MDKLLLKIANTIVANLNNTTGPGLFNGKMGISLFFYEYSRFCGNKWYESVADKLIDEIYNQSEGTTYSSLASGYGGIGVGLSYLLKKKFIEGNATEVFSKLDCCMLEESLDVAFNDLRTREQMFSSGIYLIERLGLGEINEEQIKQVMDTAQFLVSLTKDKHNRPEWRLSMLNSLIYCLSKFNQLNMDNAASLNDILLCAEKLTGENNQVPEDINTYVLLSKKIGFSISNNISQAEYDFKFDDLSEILWSRWIYGLPCSMDVMSIVDERLQNMNYYLGTVNGEFAVIGLYLLNLKENNIL